MSSQFSMSNANGKQKRFSIDDAFEEENDDIKVYSPTTKSKTNILGAGDQINVCIGNGRNFRMANNASRDSDSLIQDYYDCADQENWDNSCLRHPKVRENWRMVLAAATLLIIGLGLLITGTVTLTEPNSGLQGSVFLLAGFICFLPGIYHIIYIYLAAKGKRGYNFHNLPLFT